MTATTYLVPHVSGRRAILRMPMTDYIDDQGTPQSVDYIAADLWRLQRYQVAFSNDGKRLEAFTRQIDEWMASGRYGLLQAEEGLLLLGQGGKSDPKALQDWQDFKLRS